MQERRGGDLFRARATGGDDGFAVDGAVSPPPFARTADGRFDLSRFDRAFFDRVRGRAVEAAPASLVCRGARPAGAGGGR